MQRCKLPFRGLAAALSDVYTRVPVSQYAGMNIYCVLLNCLQRCTSRQT